MGVQRAGRWVWQDVGSGGWSSEVHHCLRLVLTLGWIRSGGDSCPGMSNTGFLFSDLSRWLNSCSPL